MEDRRLHRAGTDVYRVMIRKLTDSVTLRKKGTDASSHVPYPGRAGAAGRRRMRRRAHRAGVRSRRPSLNTGTALSATVTCPSSFNYGSTYDRTAVASGGSGTGYTFSWHSGSEYYDQGGTSKAYVPCNKNYSGGYPTSGYLTAYGTVTDSNGTSTYFSTSRSC